MTNQHTILREEWNNEFPPPTLLGQNQERVADWWLSKITLVEKNAYQKGQEDALRGRIKNMQSITIEEEVNLSPELRRFIEKATEKRVLREVYSLIPHSTVFEGQTVISVIKNEIVDYAKSKGYSINN